MKAMILAAGKGTRLHPITTDTPKPMIPLLGQRLLDRVIASLAEHGFKDIAINSAHLGDRLMDTYGNGEHLGVNLLHSYEGGRVDDELMPAPLGSAGGMRQVQNVYNFFDEDFAVVCGDAYFEFDLAKAMADHRKHKALATVLVKEMPTETLSNYGVVVSDEAGQVTSFQEKPAPGTALSNMINTGIYIFNREIFNHIPKTGEYDIGGQLLPDLVEKGVNFRSHTVDGAWLDVGKLEDLHTATATILRNETRIRPSARRFRQATWINDSAVVDPARIISRGELFIDNGAIVENKAMFDGTCTVGRNCIVRSGAVLRRSQIIGTHIEIPAGVRLHDKIVTDRFVISADGSFETLEEAGLRDARVVSFAEKIRKVG